MKLEVIVASTRPGRVGIAFARWFYEVAREHGSFDVDLCDLAELDLPMMNEPRHPRFAQYEHQHTKDWSDRVDAADAFVVVTPEYNHGMTAPFKNALDYLHNEWQYKPIGFVSYGGASAGTRGVEHAKQVVSTLKMMPVFETVSIPFFAQFLDDEKQVSANEVMHKAAIDMLGELHKWATALRTIRIPVEQTV
jgi:NAD(P)H-dependent FMN reductase